jgi:hypothetical protein
MARDTHPKMKLISLSSTECEYSTPQLDLITDTFRMVVAAGYALSIVHPEYVFMEPSTLDEKKFSALMDE